MRTLVNVLIACAVGMSLFVIPGCSHLPNAGFKSIVIEDPVNGIKGDTMQEAMIKVGRPHLKLAVYRKPTYMWCEYGLYGSTFWALHFDPTTTRLVRTNREILKHKKMKHSEYYGCDKFFRVWGDMLERREPYERDGINEILERLP